MSGPWDNYAQPQPAAQAGPWAKYAQTPGATSSDGVNRQALSDQYYRAKLAGRDDDADAMLQGLRARGWTPLPANAQQQNALFQQENANNVASQPAIQTALQGVGKAFVDTGRGIGQMLGIVSPQDIANARQADQALSDSNAGALGGLVGQTAQVMGAGGALGAGAKALGLTGRAVPYAVSALAGGGFSGSQPVAPGESRATNAALGFGLGAAGEAVPAGLRALSGKAAPAISLAKQDAIATAQQYGIPLHLSQVTDSRFLQSIGSAAKYLPFSGTTAADAAQRTAFNRALASIVGQSADDLTPAVMNAARTANSNGYNALFARNTVSFQPQTWQRLGQIARQAQQDLPPDQAQIVVNQIGKFVNAAKSNNGVIPGRLYQNVRQTVQKVEGQNQPSKFLVGQVRKTMQDAANQSIGPQDAATLQALNQQFGNLKILDKALGQAQGANYSVTPANLWRLSNTKFGASPEMTQLAQLGQTVLKDPIQNSGTAQRMLAYHTLLGGAGGAASVVNPATLPYLGGAVAIGRLFNSPLAARALPYAGQNLLLGMSKAAAPSPYLLPLLAVPRGAVGQQPVVTDQQ
jgi:hypothetical protein